MNSFWARTCPCFCVVDLARRFQFLSLRIVVYRYINSSLTPPVHFTLRVILQYLFCCVCSSVCVTTQTHGVQRETCGSRCCFPNWGIREDADVSRSGSGCCRLCRTCCKVSPSPLLDTWRNISVNFFKVG